MGRFPSFMPGLNDALAKKVQKILLATGEDNDLLSGGLLNEEQQLELWNFSRSYGVMLAGALPDMAQYPPNSPLNRAWAAQGRLPGQSSIANAITPLVPGNITMMAHKGGQLSGHYSQMYAGGTITRPSSENQPAPPAQWARKPAKLGQRLWTMDKLHTVWNVSTETFMLNVQNGQLDELLAKAMLPLMVHDFENRAINGDVDLADDGSPENELLRSNDGWLKILGQQAVAVDAEAEYIEFAHFEQAVYSVRPQYSAAGFRWHMNDRPWYNWLHRLSGRPGGPVEASRALVGEGLAPLGFPVVLVPLFPYMLPLTTIAAATSGRIIGREPGPFRFPVDAFQISLNVNGAGAVVISFPTVEAANREDRLLSAARVAAIINAQYSAAEGNAYRGVARVSQHDVVEIVSPTSGVVSNVTVAAPAANSALAVLGLTAGSHDGEDAGAGDNTVFEGSTIVLSPSENFVWHVSTAAEGSNANGLRVYSEYVADTDETRTHVYSFQDATIQTPEAAVLITNLRVSRPGVMPDNP